MNDTDKLMRIINDTSGEEEALLIRICETPSPTGKETERIMLCKDWLEKAGAKNLTIDSAGNLLYIIDASNEDTERIPGSTPNVGDDDSASPVNDDDDDSESSVNDDNDDPDRSESLIRTPLHVIMAHADTVFPDQELKVKEQDGKLTCPGIGDNSASAAAVLMSAKYIAQHHLQPKNGSVMIALTTGEEGLGNLRGSRQIIKDYGKLISEVIAIDGNDNIIYDDAVGSKRYRITAETPGGHSFSSFGNENAIHVLSDLITRLYRIEIPEEGTTTYNVGTINGGTSVNTIAQNAQMLYEIRSDKAASMEKVEKEFLRQVDIVMTEHNARQNALLKSGYTGCQGAVMESVYGEQQGAVMESVYGEQRGTVLESENDAQQSAGSEPVYGAQQSTNTETEQPLVQIHVELVGERPCTGIVPAEPMNELRQYAAQKVKKWFGEDAQFHSGSTDCSIPLSQGIPAVCIACYRGEGAHTREEYVVKKSLLPGYALAFDVITDFFDEQEDEGKDESFSIVR